MRTAVVVSGFIGALGCAHGVTTTKVDHETFRIQCSEVGLDKCLAEAASNACDKRGYFVARGISQVNLRGRSDAPDAALSSEAVVRCAPASGWGDQAKELMSGAGSSTVAPAPSVAPAPAATPAVSAAPAPTQPKAPICAPGSTQACIGTAACQGGQACNAEGSGYGPCDCGPVRGE
ncbi:MAG TPA: hypothetical protein VHP33_03100 [Polyangiaceae bacterium]|nr:hypothetical protein [Polyangiaceae bacterium]